jgi:hypothetical protein
MFLEEYNKIDEKISEKIGEKKCNEKIDEKEKENENDKKEKKVSFDLFTEIIYIPKYEKYNNYDHENLWWSDYEMNMTRIGSRDEILTLLKKHTLMTINQAKKLLYQPNNISFNSRNFL